MMSVWTKFRSALRAFRVAHTGNVAITFAFATLPIHRRRRLRRRLQSRQFGQGRDAGRARLHRADAVEGSGHGHRTQLQTNAEKYFLALFTRPEAKNITVTANFTTTGGTAVVMTATADVPTSLLGIIGYDTITVTSSSTAKWGSNRLRVALVLDNTGSMADAGKMTALQSATKSLLTQLQNAVTTNGDVYVSIVPFVKDVNLGAANWNSDYIYWGTVAQDPTLSDNNSWDANNGTCSISETTRPGAPASRSRPARFRATPPRAPAPARAPARCRATRPRAAAPARAPARFRASHTQSSCTTGTCSISGYTTQSSCTAAGTCSISGQTTQSSCTGTERLLQIAVHDEKHLPEQRRNLDYRDVDSRSMDGRRDVDSRDVDAGRLDRRRRGRPITTTPGTDASWIAAIRAAPTRRQL